MKKAAFTLVVGLSVALALASPFEAGSALISTGDGSGNTTPPTADPGFDNVGVVNGLTGVYVGNGWVLTANHVGEGATLLLGETYEPVPGSSVRFQNPDSSLADLIAYKLLGSDPPLPFLTIADTAPILDTLIVIIGNGRNRGTATTWNGLDGWTWGSGRSVRWGTNRVFDIDEFSLGTQSFWTLFDDLNPGQSIGQHEADIVDGDSGGAAFIGSGATAELIGILFARVTFVNQPASTSLYGNAGIVADLFAYRAEILAVIDQPECSDGLDDDGDGSIDFPNDPGCSDALDADERSAEIECDNGIDDDGNGLIDFPDDGGCLDSADLTEAPPLVPNSRFGAGVLAFGLLCLASSALRRWSTPIE
ncbi:MAG: trypsin-like peptidase domain-containing protein [bacterium]|nr:trypsin-like peptidase domain-containing protein [bacterium]